MSGLQDQGERSRGRLWLLAGAGLAALVAAATLAFVALAPVYGAPVGVGVASGPSMGTGGELLVVYADVGEPTVGDVVVFDAGTHHRYVRHRVVGETAAGYRTAGDRLHYVDQEKPGLAIPHVTDENLLGREVLAVPVGRAVAGAVGLLVGLVALAGVAHGRPIRSRTRSVVRTARRASGRADPATGRRPGSGSGHRRRGAVADDDYRESDSGDQRETAGGAHDSPGR